MVELLGMLLDFLDALAGAVVIAGWWCTWVSPNRQAPPLQTKAQPSEPSEVDRFLLQVRDCPDSAVVPVVTRGAVPERADCAEPPAQGAG